MGISTFGSTNVSLNQAATFVGASPKSLRTVGGKTYPNYGTGTAAMSTMLQSTSLFQVVVQSSNTSQGTVSITYPFSDSGQGAGTNYFVLSKVYSYITIVATSSSTAFGLQFECDNVEIPNFIKKRNRSAVKILNNFVLSLMVSRSF